MKIIEERNFCLNEWWNQVRTAFFYNLSFIYYFNKFVCFILILRLPGVSSSLQIFIWVFSFNICGERNNGSKAGRFHIRGNTLAFILLGRIKFTYKYELLKSGLLIKDVQLYNHYTKYRGNAVSQPVQRQLLYCIVLYWWGGYCCTNALRPFWDLLRYLEFRYY